MRHETGSNDSYEEFQLFDLKEAVITKMLNQGGAGQAWMRKSGAQPDGFCQYGKSDVGLGGTQTQQETQNAATQVNIMQD